jgi:hypothetical protein
MIDSSGTFIAAYVLVALIFAGYSLSLWSRARKARAAEAAVRRRRNNEATDVAAGDARKRPATSDSSVASLGRNES